MKGRISSKRSLRVFLCHSSKDRAAVISLYHRLLADGFSPWLDQGKLLLGQNWREEISKAVRSSNCVVVCLSKEFHRKGYLQEEVRLVLDIAETQDQNAIPVIPLKIEECEVPMQFGQHAVSNLLDKDGYERLVELLKIQGIALGREGETITGFKSSAEPAASKKIRYRLVLHGSIDNLTQSTVDSILEKLRSAVGDSSLTIKKVNSGSIIIELEGEEDGYRVLQDLYKAGKVTTIFGLKIQGLMKGGTGSTLRAEQKGVSVVFSYSHRDKKIRFELDKHLSALRHNGAVRIWQDVMMRAGDDFEAEISSHFDRAELILLLVSANFLASDYCYRKEMKRAMERHDAGEARVIPIIVSPVDWHSTPFGRLLALPTDGKPVSMWTKRDAALLDVAVGIRAAVDDLLVKHKGTTS